MLNSLSSCEILNKPHYLLISHVYDVYIYIYIYIYWFNSDIHSIQFIHRKIYTYYIYIIIIKQIYYTIGIYNYTQAYLVAIPSVKMSISLIVDPSI